jgi:hypothetical protein
MGRNMWGAHGKATNDYLLLVVRTLVSINYQSIARNTARVKFANQY